MRWRRAKAGAAARGIARLAVRLALVVTATSAVLAARAARPVASPAAAPAMAAPAAAPSTTPADTMIERAIASHIAVHTSGTIFTLFALLNAAGYDEENRAAGMHPVRIRVRAALAASVPADLRTRLGAYYRQHAATATPWNYAVVAMTTSGPPDFTPGRDWTDDLSHQDEFRDLADLPALLREFHARTPVDSLAAAVRPEYASDVTAYTAVIRREVAAALAYCRIRDPRELAGGGEQPHSVVIPNLLESYSRAFSFVLADTFYAVEGPQPVLGYNPHEFIHAVTNPLTYGAENASLQARADTLLAVARTLPDTGEATQSVAAYVDENLVRAIALRYAIGHDRTRLARANAAMQREWLAGHLLERFFFEALAHYEKGKRTLREEYPRMLARLDAGRELQLWRTARAVVPQESR